MTGQGTELYEVNNTWNNFLATLKFVYWAR